MILNSTKSKPKQKFLPNYPTWKNILNYRHSLFSWQPKSKQVKFQTEFKTIYNPKPTTQIATLNHKLSQTKNQTDILQQNSGNTHSDLKNLLCPRSVPEESNNSPEMFFGPISVLSEQSQRARILSAEPLEQSSEASVVAKSVHQKGRVVCGRRAKRDAQRR